MTCIDTLLRCERTEERMWMHGTLPFAALVKSLHALFKLLLLPSKNLSYR